MKHGLNVTEFQARLNAASPHERKAIWSKYRNWILQGSKAQGWYSVVGFPLLILSALPLVLAIQNFRLYLVAIFIALFVFGVWLVRVAFRREGDWRRDNPFSY